MQKYQKEGYQQIAEFFEETSFNEKEHAKIHLKLLQGIGNTIANLRDAATGENDEWTEMYPRMAKEAREEGFGHIADVFEGIAKIEKEHEERYLKLLKNIEEGVVFKRDSSIDWKCRNCGHIHVGTEAPEICPVCDHPQAHFEELCKNY